MEDWTSFFYFCVHLCACAGVLGVGLSPLYVYFLMDYFDYSGLCMSGQSVFRVCFRACLHGGGGPRVGEVTRLAVVEKWPTFTCKLTTPGSWGEVTRRCCKCNMNLTPGRWVTPP